MVLLLRSLACSSMSCAHLRFHLRTVFFFFCSSKLQLLLARVCLRTASASFRNQRLEKKRELLCAERPLLRAILCFFFFLL